MLAEPKGIFGPFVLVSVTHSGTSRTDFCHERYSLCVQTSSEFQLTQRDLGSIFRKLLCLLSCVTVWWHPATQWQSAPCFQQPVTESLIQTNKTKSHVQTNQNLFCFLSVRLEGRLYWLVFCLGAAGLLSREKNTVILTEICCLEPSAVLYFVFSGDEGSTGRDDPERQQQTVRQREREGRKKGETYWELRYFSPFSFAGRQIMMLCQVLWFYTERETKGSVMWQVTVMVWQTKKQQSKREVMDML